MNKKELEELGYKKTINKCPSCGRRLLTFIQKDIEGNLFCFYDDCDSSWFISSNWFDENGNFSKKLKYEEVK